MKTPGYKMSRNHANIATYMLKADLVRVIT